MKYLCEVCGREDEYETTDEAFNAGWDYPPFMGAWGVISQRTCPDCPIIQTAWWALVVEKKSPDELEERHIQTVQRILLENQPV